MFEIAICDDEPEICDLLCRFISNFERAPEIAACAYVSGEKLCYDIRMGRQFDLIILDIQLHSTDGIQIGKMLREDLRQTFTQLLYISGQRKYAMALFDLRPLNFLIKPLDIRKVPGCLREAMKLYDENSRCFAYPVRRVWHRVEYRRIRYFESRERKIAIHMPENEQVIYGKLSEIMNQLPGEDFIAIHKSYIVNLFYVRKIRYDKMVLDDGTDLPISYAYRRKVREYLRRHTLFARNE